MSRRRQLIAYDIGDPKRLRRVIAIMESYGTRLQYSVFLCDLSIREQMMWREEIMDVILLREDSIVRIDLGEVERAAFVEVIGKARKFPPSPGGVY